VNEFIEEVQRRQWRPETAKMILRHENFGGKCGRCKRRWPCDLVRLVMEIMA